MTSNNTPEPQDRAAHGRTASSRVSTRGCATSFSTARSSTRCAIGRIEPAARVVEKVEQHRVQHGEAIAAERAILPARLPGLALESPRIVVKPRGLPLRHGLKLYLLRGAVAPHRPGGIGLRRREAGARLAKFAALCRLGTARYPGLSAALFADPRFGGFCISGVCFKPFGSYDTPHDSIRAARRACIKMQGVSTR
jgi:hypothetical protein